MLLTTLAIIIMITMTGIANAGPQEKLNLAIRGNTAVLSVPDEWLMENMPFSGWDDNSFGTSYFGVSEEWIEIVLPEDEYKAFMDLHKKGLDARSRTYLLEIFSNNEPQFQWANRLEMNVRRLDGVWHLVFRQSEISLDHICTIFPVCVYSENGKLFASRYQDSFPDGTSFDIHKETGEAIYEAEIGHIEVEVYKANNVYVAVLKQNSNQQDSSRYASILIDGEEIANVSGYTDRGNDIYCVILDTGELQKIQSGAKLEIKTITEKKEPDWKSAYRFW